MTSARPMPTRRTCVRVRSAATFCERIATRRTLSIPSTISMTDRLTRLASPAPVNKAPKSNTIVEG